MVDKNLPVKWKFGVVDKLSGTIDKLKRKFPDLARTVRRSNNAFKVLNKRTERFSKLSTKLGNKAKSAGKSMTVGLTAPILAFGAATLRTAVRFEQSMNKVAALTKATGKPLNNMRELAKKLGSETQFSASQAADAMSFLGMAGFSTNKILAATPGLLDLAAASGTDLARTADIASNIMGAFGIKASEMNRVADVLAATTASSNVNMEMMAETMKKAAPIAKRYGLSLEETSAAIGLLGNVGIQGSLAGTTLNNMMLNLAAPGSKVKKIFSELGIKAIDPTTGKMRKLNDILGDLGKGLEKIPEAKQLAVLNEVFGKRAVAGAGELLTQALKLGDDGKNAISRFTDSLNNSDGAAKRMAATMNKGAPGAVKSLISAFEGLQIAIAESGVLEIFTDIVKDLTGFLRTIAKTSPAMIKMAVGIALGVAALGPLLFGIGSLLVMLPFALKGFVLLRVGLMFFSKALLPLITKFIPLLLTGLKGIAISLFAAAKGAFALLIPFAPLIIAAGLLATAGYLIWKNWQPLKEFFSDLFTDPLQQMKDMIGFASELASKAGAFFGFGSGESETDKKLKAQGFNIDNGKAQGKPIGADTITKKTNDFMIRQQKAQVDVKFANLPPKTMVMTEDKDSLLNVLTGPIGAF